VTFTVASAASGNEQYGQGERDNRVKKSADRLVRGAVSSIFHSVTKDTPPPGDERTILSVLELSERLRALIEPRFRQVWVRGEVSNLRPAGSGHRYFTIKDDKAVISAVLFRGDGETAGALPADGMEALFQGDVSLYPPRGNYQLIVRRIEETGLGALAAAFEKLKRKLQAEGLFEPSRKRPLPLFPHRVGIVTSPGGAALQDILHVSRKRFPGIDIVVYPALVQGSEAAREVAGAIEQAAADNLVDVLIIARGGGSLEDLWPFNDERLARTIAACPIPTVSGVGHEIDFTIADFVADRRAPTPSAAAELVFPEREAFREGLVATRERLALLVRRRIENNRRILGVEPAAALARGMRTTLDRKRLRLADLCDGLPRRLTDLLQARRLALATASGRLAALDPLGPQRRGYALVRSRTGLPVTAAAGLLPDTALDLCFADGTVPVRVEGTITNEHARDRSAPS
jgi:exodeoxyribonuclease VII large subunit